MPNNSILKELIAEDVLDLGAVITRHFPGPEIDRLLITLSCPSCDRSVERSFRRVLGGKATCEVCGAAYPSDLVREAVRMLKAREAPPPGSPFRILPPDASQKAPKQ